MSDDEKGFVTLGILAIVVFKILIIMLGICVKLCKSELRPENEYVRNLISPAFIPSFTETNREHKRKQTQALLHRLERIDTTPASQLERRTEKSETIDMGGAKSYYVYYRMEDQRKNRNLCCKCLYGLWWLLEYLYLLFLFLYKLFKWLIKTSFWLIIFTFNFICSIWLFYIHHSPIVGADTMDFCSQGDKDSDPLTNRACTIGQDTCGVVNWIILPDVEKYLIPRYITLIIAC